MKIKTSQFCSMAKSDDWRNWLKETDSDLFVLLDSVIEQRKGCKTNKEVMMRIYKLLYEKNHGDAFEAFMSSRYPWIIDDEKQIVRVSTAPQKRIARAASDFNNLDTHGVFRSYRPDLLSFPQKLILVDEPDKLKSKVLDFITDKIGVDYIIINDHAYIEYLHSKYADIENTIPTDAREIQLYRMREAQNVQ